MNVRQELPTSAPAGLRVFVYFNLHRTCWSVKALEGPDKGRVIAHIYSRQRHELALRDVTFKVSEAGRQRVLREGKKNVHAGVVGRVADGIFPPLWDSERVSYNPRKGPTFYSAITEEPVHTAEFVEFAWFTGIRAVGLA